MELIDGDDIDYSRDININCEVAILNNIRIERLNSIKVKGNSYAIIIIDPYYIGKLGKKTANIRHKYGIEDVEEYMNKKPGYNIDLSAVTDLTYVYESGDLLSHDSLVPYMNNLCTDNVIQISDFELNNINQFINKIEKNIRKSTFKKLKKYFCIKIN